MKKLIAVLLCVCLLFTMFCGCKDSDTLSSDITTAFDIQDNFSESTESLYNVINNIYNVDKFNKFTVYYLNNCYLINNKQNNFVSEMFKQFDKYYVDEIENYDINVEAIDITFWDVDDLIPIFINEKDQIKINYEKDYYVEGIYDSIVNYITPILEENNKYYSLEYSEDNFMYNYEIYDYKGNVIEGDSTPKSPHISICEDYIVWFWLQGGTGTLTRWAYFYNTLTGKKSPAYYGITDCYESLVLSSESKSVIISDMFSGTVLQTIDKFSMEPYDAIETISDARFIENGTKVSITYLANDLSKQTEIFDIIMPSEKELPDDLPQWKRAYIEFLKDKDGEYISFALVNIDDDDIPELYMSGGCEATGDSISSYKSGEVVEEHLNRIGGGRYIEKGGEVLNQNGNMGNCYTHAYKLTDDGFMLTFTAYSAEHIINVENDEYDITYEFSVEDVPVTEQEYNDALNKAFDFDKSKRLNENTVSYDVIIAQISNFN